MRFADLLARVSSSAPVTLAQEILAPEELPSYGIPLLKLFGVFVSLLLAIFLAVWVLRRFSKGNFCVASGKSIRILERKALSPKTVLYLVEINGKRMALAESHLEVQELRGASDEEQGSCRS